MPQTVYYGTSNCGYSNNNVQDSMSYGSPQQVNAMYNTNGNGNGNNNNNNNTNNMYNGNGNTNNHSNNNNNNTNTNTNANTNMYNNYNNEDRGNMQDHMRRKYRERAMNDGTDLNFSQSIDRNCRQGSVITYNDGCSQQPFRDTEVEHVLTVLPDTDPSTEDKTRKKQKLSVGKTSEV